MMGKIYTKLMNYDEYYSEGASYKEKEEREKEYTYDLKIVREKCYKSTAVNLSINKNYNEKCVDIQMDEVKYTRVFGTVKDLEGNVAENVRVVLFRAKLINYKTEYVAVCDMITDKRGMYESLIENDYCEDHYIIKVQDE